MTENEVLIPQKYEVYMQDLDKEHLEITQLGFVTKIGEARTMVKTFREVLQKEGKNATVFFKHIENI